MVRRYFILSKHYVISGIIIVLMLLSLERSMYLGISSATGNLPVEGRLTNFMPAILALSSSAAADLSTMIAMFWKLKVTDTYSRITHNLVRRMSAVVIITGTATCMVGLAIMISFLTYPLSTLSTCFASFAGRVYSLTMLFTLLYRDMIKDDQWIQIDDSAPGDVIPSANGSDVPGASTPLSSMTFASPATSPRPNSHRQCLMIEYEEPPASGSAVREMPHEEVG
ncbi:hypothetical protein D9619_011117 [Psilocybe cf. subviscida]|uniref:DUF6534 domain-containing protein n=1 Tax=Psilocybe cf. subviscida TaxID=2480587 RepID=A0A8H5BIS6_9AGAR|nr:hypothetical protein D9619_011117 [Psilocybe cf. subviscida]